MRKEFTIKASTKNELANKVCLLFGWTKKSIGTYSINFTNFEKVYYYHDKNGYHTTFEDTYYVFNKAKKMNLL